MAGEMRWDPKYGKVLLDDVAERLGLPTVAATILANLNLMEKEHDRIVAHYQISNLPVEEMERRVSAANTNIQFALVSRWENATDYAIEFILQFIGLKTWVTHGSGGAPILHYAPRTSPTRLTWLNAATMLHTLRIQTGLTDRSTLWEEMTAESMPTPAGYIHRHFWDIVHIPEVFKTTSPMEMWDALFTSRGS